MKSMEEALTPNDLRVSEVFEQKLRVLRTLRRRLRRLFGGFFSTVEKYEIQDGSQALFRTLNFRENDLFSF